jgi:hypothetical protein
MEFDPDRLAKLAGISGAEPVSKPAAKQAPAPSGLIRESAASSRRSHESREVKQLRQLIRTEASQVIREMRAERRALAEGNITRLQTRRSLTEAVAMGFYGPGFGDPRAPVLGGPIGSRTGWFLNEQEGDSGDVVSDAEREISGLTPSEAIENLRDFITNDETAEALANADPDPNKAKAIIAAVGEKMTTTEGVRDLFSAQSLLSALGLGGSAVGTSAAVLETFDLSKIAQYLTQGSASAGLVLASLAVAVGAGAALGKQLSK